MSIIKPDSQSSDWRKTRHSMAWGNCVEVRPVNGAIAIRDSKSPRGCVLECSAQSWRAFTLAVREGRFDVHRQ
jgi:Domain of unknown function (DUF397)